MKWLSGIWWKQTSSCYITFFSIWFVELLVLNETNLFLIENDFTCGQYFVFPLTKQNLSQNYHDFPRYPNSLHSLCVSLSKTNSCYVRQFKSFRCSLSPIYLWIRIFLILLKSSCSNFCVIIRFYLTFLCIIIYSYSFISHKA